MFSVIFRSWCHNPVATLSLCLLAQAYELSSELISNFAEVEITVGFLLQIDRLVQLIESPIFVHLRLQLLDGANAGKGTALVEDASAVANPFAQQRKHAALLKSLYGLLMLLPQCVSSHKEPEEEINNQRNKEHVLTQPIASRNFKTKEQSV